jgi:hypothetical protein
MTELDFGEVERLWLAAGGKDTLGILRAFRPPTAQPWVLSEIAASAVADLRFIGTDAGGRWDERTRGTHRIGDLDLSRADPTFGWDPQWNLFAVRDTENNQRVLIDGNERAEALYPSRTARSNETNRSDSSPVISTKRLSFLPRP